VDERVPVELGMKKEKEKRKKRQLVASTGLEEGLLLGLVKMRVERTKRPLVAPTGPEEGLLPELVKRTKAKKRKPPHVAPLELDGALLVVSGMEIQKMNAPLVAPPELDGVLLVVPWRGIQKKKAPLVAAERDEELLFEPGMEGEKSKAPLVALGFARGEVLVASEEQRRRPAVAPDGHGWRMVEAFLWSSHSPCLVGAVWSKELRGVKTGGLGSYDLFFT
jgi:hypothetical protein